jgi:hypothetical protein
MEINPHLTGGTMFGRPYTIPRGRTHIQLPNLVFSSAYQMTDRAHKLSKPANILRSNCVTCDHKQPNMRHTARSKCQGTRDNYIEYHEMFLTPRTQNCVFRNTTNGDENGKRKKKRNIKKRRQIQKDKVSLST